MLKPVPVDQVRLGMYIHELKGAWVDHPFWKSKFVLKEPTDLQKLRASIIKEVVIDVSLGMDIDLAGVVEQASSASPPPKEKVAPAVKVRLSLKEEGERASKIIQSTRTAVASMFKEIRLGKTIDPATVLPFVDEIAESVSRNTHALISLVRLKSVDDYTYMHSVAVCALMITLAKEMGLTDTEVRQAGLAGIMHDMGKAKVPIEILNKPSTLTDSEFDVIRMHPELGHELLLQANITDPVTLDVCLHHHEKVDGSGYPKRLVSDQISVFAKMGAICDVYDAVTSTRTYKPAWEPGMALKRMASWTGHFDQDIFKAFVKSLGIYPVGTVVILKSGRLAVVVEQSDHLLKPVVKAFFSTKSKMRLQVEKLDLSLGMDEIVGNESAATWGIQNIEHLWTTY